MNSIQQSLILFLVLFLFSCQSKNDPDDIDLKNHLSTALVENPRSLKDDSISMNQLGRLVFADTIHDFGRMTEGEIVEYNFEFVNKGKKDILISEAKASCGCTVPSYPQKPIRYEEKDMIKIKFNSQGKKGFNEKLTIVKTNGNPAVYNLYIRAEVHAK